MGIRVVQRITAAQQQQQQQQQPKPKMTNVTTATATAAVTKAPKLNEESRPRATLDKTFLFSDGAIKLEAALDKAVYSHEDTVNVTLSINNETKKNIRRLKVSPVAVAVAVAIAVLQLVHLRIRDIRSLFLKILWPNGQPLDDERRSTTKTYGEARLG